SAGRRLHGQLGSFPGFLPVGAGKWSACRFWGLRNVAFLSALADPQPIQQVHDSTLNFFSHRAYLVHGLSRRVVELPILVALTRQQWAGVAATHRDNHISR